MQMEEEQGTIIPDDIEPFTGLEMHYDPLDMANDGVSEVYRASSYILGEKQNTKYYCGPFTVRQMLHELYNLTPSQEALADYAGTTSNGTCHTGINKALKLGVGKRKIDSEWKSFKDMCWKELGRKMANPYISVGFHVAYRDKWGHYMYPVYLNLTTQVIGCLDSINKGNDVVYVSLRDFESWIKNTPGGQNSVVIAYKPNNNVEDDF